MSYLLSSTLSNALSVVLAVVILLVMVTIHEFGHYLAGKIFKFKINEFAVGFGPALLKKKRKNGEIFSLRLIPLGGFCAFAGEDGLEEQAAQSQPFADFDQAAPTEASAERVKTFTQHAPWQRIVVLFAGAFMNYLLALACIMLSFGFCGQTAYKVEGVASEATYRLQEGDVVLAVEGKVVYFSSDLSKPLSGKKTGDTVTVTVLREGERIKAPVTLQGDCVYNGTNDVSKALHALGVGTQQKQVDGVTRTYYAVDAVAVKHGFFTTVGHSFVYSGKIAGTIFQVLGDLFTGRIGIDSMGGPVTTIKMTSEIASQGWQEFFSIVAYIGVNLAVFNLLPIPALDGSKIVFCVIEWIFKKPVPRKVEAIIHAVGIVLIFGFAILVDLLQLI